MLPQQSLYHLKQCRLSNCFPVCLQKSAANKEKESFCQDGENMIVARVRVTVRNLIGARVTGREFIGFATRDN